MENYILIQKVTALCLQQVFKASVRGTCTGDYTSEQIDAWIEKADLQRWRDLLDSSLQFFAAEYVPTGEVVGFTSVDCTGYLHSMFVHPAHQHRGVAGFLIRAAEEFAMKHKAVALDAEVSITARPFFEKQGFRMKCAQTVDVSGVEMDNFVMQKLLVYEAEEADYDELISLWEASVRRTHHFLEESDIQFYKPLVMEEGFPAASLHVVRNIAGRIMAFIGLRGDRIEMLFVHPNERGKGYGSRLVDFALQCRSVHRVDVNEQNREALDFYLHKGFRVVSRDELDSAGKPFPVLHMNREE